MRISGAHVTRLRMHTTGFGHESHQVSTFELCTERITRCHIIQKEFIWEISKITTLIQSAVSTSHLTTIGRNPPASRQSNGRDWSVPPPQPDELLLAKEFSRGRTVVTVLKIASRSVRRPCLPSFPSNAELKHSHGRHIGYQPLVLIVQDSTKSVRGNFQERPKNLECISAKHRWRLELGRFQESERVAENF